MGMRYVLAIAFLIIATVQFPQICKTIEQNLGQNNKFVGSSELAKTKSCFVYLIEKGQYQSIDSLEQSLDDSEQKIMTELLNEQIRRLEAIDKYVIQSKSTCEPVLKWAQNLTHVFIAAKMSHRWDSPPCLKTVEEIYQLNDSSLILKNICLVSNAQIKFYLKQKLYKNAKNGLQVKKDGVGTYSLTFQKQKQELWPFLFNNNQKIQTWHEIMSRNETLKSQFDKLQQEIEASYLNSPKNWLSYLRPGDLILLLGLYLIS